MRFMMRCLCAGLLLGLLGACSLPRGAVLLNEVVKEKDAEVPSYQVVHVTRAKLALLAEWPRSGGEQAYHWPTTTRGPQSGVIRAGDTVDLIIWDNDENSLLTSLEQKSTEMRGLTVSSSGAIFVPYLTDVVVTGMTPNDARRHIQKQLEVISPSAQVQLIHKPGAGNSVDLVTGVPKPGSYPLPSRNTSILSLLSLGGGISKDVRNPVVRLIRGQRTYNIRAADLFSTEKANIILRGGDKVLVREDGRYFTSLGATGTEELVYFDREKITVLEALSMVGGFNDNRANLKGMLVLRDYGPGQIAPTPETPDLEQVVFAFDLTTAEGLFAARQFRVNPGDTVIATESPVTAARTIFGILGSAVGLANNVSN